MFDKQICGGSKLSIFQYSMVLFWHKNDEEESWVSRSLFVMGGHLLVCIEDLAQFNSISLDASYFQLDTCCSIADVSEMVIDAGERWCATLALDCATSELHPFSAETGGAGGSKSMSTWKLKWFSVESLLKFTALLKAIRRATSPLVVRLVS